jgi:hypothetical protein
MEQIKQFEPGLPWVNVLKKKKNGTFMDFKQKNKNSMPLLLSLVD